MAFWVGNFFPDMRAWDRLVPFRNRGAGGHVVWIRFPGSTFVAHMSVFPARSYKKAHRHGPGTVIVIPSGEGFSVMWPEGQDKVFIPWHEASVFVPPNRWYHQHFNLTGDPARYLAFHGVRGFTSEQLTDRLRDQIEYPDEDPVVRQYFEGELGKRGLTSLMPEQAYRDSSYQWTYEDDK
jgi:gentisate 1,2-dioxygenase